VVFSLTLPLTTSLQLTAVLAWLVPSLYFLSTDFVSRRFVMTTSKRVNTLTYILWFVVLLNGNQNPCINQKYNERNYIDLYMVIHVVMSMDSTRNQTSKEVINLIVHTKCRNFSLTLKTIYGVINMCRIVYVCYKT
jgi:hypothetical protein